VVPYQPRGVSSLNSPFGEEEFGVPSDLETFFTESERELRELLGEKPIKKVPSVGELTGESESESEEEGEEEALPIIKYKLYDDDKMIKFTHGDKEIFIRFTKGITVNDKIITQSGKEKKLLKHEFPNFFYSLTGDKGSFYLIKGIGLFDKISTVLDIPPELTKKSFGITRRVQMSKQKILDVLNNFGLKKSTEGVFIRDGKTRDGETHAPEYDRGGVPLFGLGIKKADNLPDKVPFGSNILLLKKLFLKNILSIQNKHNTKINGFNNVHVSDNFVKIIMNLLKGVNFTNSELQNLTNNERLLLDNLLMLSELNKKFVTGSSTASLNQLKKDYEILIGEIDAGNNNEILKKKLYNILMRMVHFGALSQIQALKHYKEILKSHF